MVTWTFDLLALLVGIIIGIVIGGLIFILFEMRDGGSWSKGFSDGFDLKCNFRDLKEILQKAKEDQK